MTIKVFVTMTVVVASITLLPAIKADDWDKQTRVTVNTVVAIPGQVLTPGGYIFKLAANNSDRNIVQISDEDQSHIIATLLTAPAWRAEPTNDTVITLGEQSNAGPKVLDKWFYPGEQGAWRGVLVSRQSAIADLHS